MDFVMESSSDNRNIKSMNPESGIVEKSEEWMLQTLEELDNNDFTKFKWRLKQPDTGFVAIIDHRLKDATRTETFDLMNHLYVNNKAEVMEHVLKMIHREDLLHQKDVTRTPLMNRPNDDHPREGGPGRNSGIGGDISSRRRVIICVSVCVFLFVGVCACVYAFHFAEKCTTACPDQTWSSFGGHCYKHVAGQSTWDKAEQDCVSKGRNSEEAHLVSIHSLDEHNFVRQLISDNDPKQDEIWIGLSDSHKEGDWRWTDGSTLTYTNWNAGEPNNDQSANGGRGKGENCAATVSGQKHLNWNDRPCDEIRNHVCKLLCPKK